ncbi:MAG: flavohemoglobin expression-modulating QEGLA motif protein [bacterium]
MNDPIAEIIERLRSGKRVRRAVFGNGRIFLDRQLPFLVLYRKPVDLPDLGTQSLAITEAAYLVVENIKKNQKDICKLIGHIRDFSVEKFGVFLLVELWARHAKQPLIAEMLDDVIGPGFRLYSWPQNSETDTILDSLQQNLKKLVVASRTSIIDCPEKLGSFRHRPHLMLDRNLPDTYQIGIEIEPCYRNRNGDQIFPVVLKMLRTHVSKALRYCFYNFIRQETRQRPSNFNVLGRRTVVKAVWEIDARLNEISSSFDFLMCINPSNSTQLWKEFMKSNFEKLPQLRYRPLPIDVFLAKRALFDIPVERIEDPSLALVFNEKQEELDRQLTMLKDRGTTHFMLGGLQLYGNITPSLTRMAEEVLERVPGKARNAPLGRILSNDEMKRMAEKEIAWYQNIWSGVDAHVKLSANIMAGLMVSQGTLFILQDSRTPYARVEALIQHEIGTHLVTYYNGKAQPLTQLCSGFAGYEELQEGLAVLAEYLVGGLTRARLRTLAARVLAAKSILDGATFIDTFRLLCRYGFAPQLAFSLTLRIYRGGGLIKDCIYLRGFQTILHYLSDGGELDRLYVGKIALKHLPIIDELESRKVLSSPKLKPRFLDRPECQKRLEKIRTNPRIYELIEQ